MGVMLAEAAHCEHQGCYGYESNHQVGNQTGDELRKIAYYSLPWSYVFRAKTASIAKAIAVRQEQAVDNLKIGYSQPNRATYMAQLLKANYDPSKITELCDCDCSSLTNGNVYVTLLSCGVKTNINGYEVTAQMPDAYHLCTSMFDDVTSKIDLATGSGLKIGDILVTPSKHTAVVIREEDTTTTTEKKQSVGTVTTGLYLRTGTITDGKLNTGNAIMVMPQNAVVTINSEVNTVSGALWYNVTYHGATGYASSKYIVKK